MSLSGHTKALMDDVDATRMRVHLQLATDSDHEVALAMFNADFKRASAALTAHLADEATARAAELQKLEALTA